MDENPRPGRGLPIEGRVATTRQKNSGTSAGSISSTIGNKTLRGSRICGLRPDPPSNDRSLSRSETPGPRPPDLATSSRGRGTGTPPGGQDARCDSSVSLRAPAGSTVAIFQAIAGGSQSLPGFQEVLPRPDDKLPVDVSSSRRRDLLKTAFGFGGIVRGQAEGDVPEDPASGFSDRLRGSPLRWPGPPTGRLEPAGRQTSLADSPSCRPASGPSGGVPRRRASWPFPFPSSYQRSATWPVRLTRMIGVVTAFT